MWAGAGLITPVNVSYFAGYTNEVIVGHRARAIPNLRVGGPVVDTVTGDTTRLASSPSGIWRDIVATNADELRAALDALIVVLQELRSDVDDGDRLAEVFESANRWRDKVAGA